jgi:hypothetical protein
MTSDPYIPDDSLRPHALPPDALVSCVFCMSVLRFEEITQWVDGGETPLCPRCLVDCILRGARSAEALAVAHENAFGLPPGVRRMTAEEAAAFTAALGASCGDEE